MLIKYLKEQKEKRVEYQNEMLKQRVQNAKILQVRMVL